MGNSTSQQGTSANSPGLVTGPVSALLPEPNINSIMGNSTSQQGTSAYSPGLVTRPVSTPPVSTPPVSALLPEPVSVPRSVPTRPVALQPVFRCEDVTNTGSMYYLDQNKAQLGSKTVTDRNLHQVRRVDGQTCDQRIVLYDPAHSPTIDTRRFDYTWDGNKGMWVVSKMYPPGVGMIESFGIMDEGLFTGKSWESGVILLILLIMGLILYRNWSK